CLVENSPRESVTGKHVPRTPHTKRIARGLCPFQKVLRMVVCFIQRFDSQTQHGNLIEHQEFGFFIAEFLRRFQRLFRPDKLFRRRLANAQYIGGINRKGGAQPRPLSILFLSCRRPCLPVLNLRPILLHLVKPVFAVSTSAPDGGVRLLQFGEVMFCETMSGGLHRRRERHSKCSSSSSRDWACMTSSACIWKRPPLTGSSKPRLTNSRAIGFGSSTFHATAIASRSNVA